MDVTDVTTQPLSTLVADFFVCNCCGIVDRDEERCLKGRPCSACGDPSRGGHSYWGMRVDALIDLIQEAYHRPESPDWAPWLNAAVASHRLAVVIFFCTLGEVLLDHLLIECMLALKIPPKVRDRLLEDNLSAKQRVDRLFPTLTGSSWRKAVSNLDPGSKLAYSATVAFYLDVVEQRNTLLHSGGVWAVQPKMPQECLRRISPLLNLFGALHDAFVHHAYLQKDRRYDNEPA